MNTANNTVLISGGTAGIGFEIAKRFAANGSKVIITGRDKDRLDKAVSQLQNGTGIISDVSNATSVDALVTTIKNDFPDLNIVINNAGRAQIYKLTETENVYDIAEDEMLTNYLSVIRLNEKLLPILSVQKEAAIVNVSSVVAFVPGSLATYSASKAALHSYTQSLRFALADKTNLKVFELMPPLVNTAFSKPIGGENGIEPSVVAADLLKGLENDTYEIRVGNTEAIYQLYRKSPEEAFAALNKERK